MELTAPEANTHSMALDAPEATKLSMELAAPEANTHYLTAPRASYSPGQDKDRSASMADIVFLSLSLPRFQIRKARILSSKYTRGEKFI